MVHSNKETNTVVLLLHNKVGRQVFITQDTSQDSHILTIKKKFMEHYKEFKITELLMAQSPQKSRFGTPHQSRNHDQLHCLLRAKRNMEQILEKNKF